MKCKICKTELTKTQRMYCSTKCKSKGHYDDHVRNRNTTFSQFKRADERKKEFIEMKGGGCQHCGYNKNYAALDFHHLGKKNFSMDSRNIGNRSLESLLKELKNCELLCKLSQRRTLSSLFVDSVRIELTHPIL